MPAGAIANQQSVCAGCDLATDFLEMLVHRFSVHGRHDDGSANAAGWADGAEDVNGIVPVAAHHRRARADRRPDGFDGAFLPDPGFIREPYLKRLALSRSWQSFYCQAAKFFLNSSCAAKSCLG